MRRILFFTIGFLFLFHFTKSQDSRPIIFILDASGSMWQKVGEEYKILSAREVLGDLINGMADDQQIGLVAYGHRQKDECSDIEEILPATNLKKGDFKKALEELNPIGMTPLASSAQLVIDDLKSNNQKATIILLTDGIETCEGDLCAVVKNAKDAGIDFVLHIVGFNLGEADRAPLECAARASEGLYIDAEDKDQLAKALKQTSELTVDVPKGRLSVECKRNNELIDGAIIVYKQGTNEEVAFLRSYTGPQTNPAIFSIPPGTYDVQVRIIGRSGIQPMKRTYVIVAEKEINRQLFDFSSGFLQLTVTENGALHDATVNVRTQDDNRRVAGGRTYTSSDFNPIKKELSPGIYKIEIGSVSIKGLSSKTIIKNISVIGGQTSVQSHDFESAILILGATLGGDLCDASVNIVSVEPKKPIASGRTYTTSNSNPKSFVLCPGEYVIQVKGLRLEGDPRETFKISLKAGDRVERIINW